MRKFAPASFVLLVLFATAVVATEPPVGVFRIPSVDALARQLDAQVFPGSPGSGKRVVQALLEMLGLPEGEWLDRHQPLYVTTSQSGLMGDRTGWAVVVPVADPGAALRALGSSTGEEPEDGVYTTTRDADSQVYFEVDRRSLAVAASRDALGSVDRAVLEAMAFPEGGIAFDLDLEALAPLIEGVLAAQRMVLEQQAAAQPESGESQTGAGPSLGGLMGVFFDVLAVLQANVSHIQLSLDRIEGQALLRLRVLPPAGSDLEALLGEQPEGFSKVARALPDDPALVVYAANLRLTEVVRDGLQDFLVRYGEVLEQMQGSIGDSETSWIGGLFGGQGRLMEKRLRCFRGDFAGRYDLGGEAAGYRSALVAGVDTRVSCEGLVDDEIAAAAEMLGPDGQPLATVTRQALMHGGVGGARIDYDLAQLLPDESEEDGAEFAEMFGEGGLTSYYGQVDDVMLTMAGRDAGQGFVEAVDRLRSHGKKGRLTSEYFAPLKPGAGVYLAIDFEPILGYFANDSEEQEPQDAEQDEQDHRLVIGIHRDDEFLALEAVFPSSFLSKLPTLGIPGLSRVLAAPPADSGN